MSNPSPQAQTNSAERIALPAGSLIDCYLVKRLIGAGGFSLIYLAEDEHTHDEVTIKEYFPKHFGTRIQGNLITAFNNEKKHSYLKGLRLFFQEAKALAKLDHPNIVNVKNCCLANNTAYLITHYEPGKNLGRYVKQREGNMSTRFLLNVFQPLINALQAIHDNHLLHLDIKPSNIHLRPGGSPILLDFGAAFHREDINAKKARVVTPGFSPIEQYFANGEIGPWTDIYALAASIRASIEGKPPPTSVERHAEDTLTPAAEAFKELYPQYILKAIDWGMKINPEERPQSAQQLLSAFSKI